MKTSSLIAGFLALFMACSLAHAQWANTAPRGTDAPPSRTIDEIQLAFDRTKHVFTKLFYKAGIGPGKIVVGITISPDGAVKDCYVASSTYESSSFNEAVLLEVRKLKFRARNVPEFTYPNYPIVFNGDP